MAAEKRRRSPHELPTEPMAQCTFACGSLFGHAGTEWDLVSWQLLLSNLIERPRLYRLCHRLCRAGPGFWFLALFGEGLCEPAQFKAHLAFYESSVLCLCHLVSDKLHARSWRSSPRLPFLDGKQWLGLWWLSYASASLRAFYRRFLGIAIVDR